MNLLAHTADTVRIDWWSIGFWDVFGVVLKVFLVFGAVSLVTSPIWLLAAYLSGD